jgi:hypothetical protein
MLRTRSGRLPDRADREELTKRLALCFIGGAALGTALDALHAYGDVESYANETFGRLAWFVPLEFGLAGLAAGILVPVLDERFAGRPLSWSTGDRARELALIVALYLATVAGNGWGAVLLAIAFTAIVVWRLASAPAPGDWVFALTAGIVGPAVEAALVAIGAFDYTEPDLLGVPVWLFPLWANGGLVIRRLFGCSIPQPHARG